MYQRGLMNDFDVTGEKKSSMKDFVQMKTEKVGFRLNRDNGEIPCMPLFSFQFS